MFCPWKVSQTVINVGATVVSAISISQIYRERIHESECVKMNIVKI